MTPLPSKSDPDVFPDASRYLGSVHIEHYFRFSPENRSPSSCFLSPSSVQVKLFLSLGIVSALCRCAQNKLVGDGSSTGSDPRLLPSAPFLSLRHVVDDPLPPKKFRDLSQRAFSPRWRDHDVPSSKEPPFVLASISGASPSVIADRTRGISKYQRKSDHNVLRPPESFVLDRRKTCTPFAANQIEYSTFANNHNLTPSRLPPCKGDQVENMEYRALTAETAEAFLAQIKLEANKTKQELETKLKQQEEELSRVNDTLRSVYENQNHFSKDFTNTVLAQLNTMQQEQQLQLSSLEATYQCCAQQRDMYQQQLKTMEQLKNAEHEYWEETLQKLECQLKQCQRQQKEATQPQVGEQKNIRNISTQTDETAILPQTKDDAIRHHKDIEHYVQQVTSLTNELAALQKKTELLEQEKTQERERCETLVCERQLLEKTLESTELKLRHLEASSRLVEKDLQQAKERYDGMCEEMEEKITHLRLQLEDANKSWAARDMSWAAEREHLQQECSQLQQQVDDKTIQQTETMQQLKTNNERYDAAFHAYASLEQTWNAFIASKPSVENPPPTLPNTLDSNVDAAGAKTLHSCLLALHEHYVTIVNRVMLEQEQQQQLQRERDEQYHRSSEALRLQAAETMHQASTASQRVEELEKEVLRLTVALKEALETIDRVRQADTSGQQTHRIDKKSPLHKKHPSITVDGHTDADHSNGTALLSGALASVQIKPKTVLEKNVVVAIQTPHSESQPRKDSPLSDKDSFSASFESVKIITAEHAMGVVASTGAADSESNNDVLPISVASHQAPSTGVAPATTVVDSECGVDDVTTERETASDATRQSIGDASNHSADYPLEQAKTSSASREESFSTPVVISKAQTSFARDIVASSVEADTPLQTAVAASSSETSSSVVSSLDDNTNANVTETVAREERPSLLGAWPGGENFLATLGFGAAQPAAEPPPQGAATESESFNFFSQLGVRLPFGEAEPETKEPTQTGEEEKDGKAEDDQTIHVASQETTPREPEVKETQESWLSGWTWPT